MTAPNRTERECVLCGERFIRLFSANTPGTLSALLCAECLLAAQQGDAGELERRNARAPWRAKEA